MAKPVFYLFNGKVARFGNAVFGGIGSVPPEPDPFSPVQIGDQIWSSKNLAIDDGGEGITTQTVNYGQGDVVEYYYTWNAAVRVAESIQGWHLATDDEWLALAAAVGGTSIAGTKLKSTYGWIDPYTDGNGTDDFGFTAFPAGLCNSGSFKNLSTNAYFWTATNRSSTYSYYRWFNTGSSMSQKSYTKKTDGYSVRLVKDT